MTPIRRPSSGPDLAALLRYVSGASPLAEGELIRAWAAEDPAREATIAELQAAWSIRPAVPEWDRAGVWDRLASELTDERAPMAFSAKVSARRRPRILMRRPASPMVRLVRWSLAAAAVVALFAAGDAVVSRRDSATRIPAVTMREVVTRRGQQATLDLADGSRVMLAADSKLRIPSDFDAPGRHGRRRVLELEGRAYFDVKHDPVRPFLVRTSTAVTEDIGTSFVMSAYPETHVTQVVVVTGSVALWDPPAKKAMVGSDSRSPLMVLTRGDAATLDTNGTAIRMRNVSLAHYTEWTEGVLRFNREPLDDAVRELERWYDIDIRLADASLHRRHITAETGAETASEAMRHLAVVLGVGVRENGRVFTLTPHAGGPGSSNRGE